MKSGSTPPEKTTGLRLFRALNHRNYRLYFAGQIISMIGTWMQQIAMNWLLYRLTHSPFLLGILGFTGRAPAFFLSPFAGVLIDRWDRHRILIITQALAMIQAFILAILVLTETVEVWHILLLSFFLGLVNSADVPARQSFVIDLVERREHLANAIALNSSIQNGARLLGPSVAGILIAAVGEGMCFLLNGISFFAVIAALLAMRIKPIGRKMLKPQVVRDLKEGFSYAFRFAPIGSLLLLLALVSLMAMPYTILMPIFAANVLNGGPQTLGFLLAATGLGALGGAIFLGSRRSVLGLGRVIVMASSIFGISLIFFSFSRVLLLSLSLMLLTGFGQMVQNASSNTVLQTLVEEDKRGRVMSMYAMANFGMVPFGSLLSGTLGTHIGAPITVMIGGVTCILGAILFARKLPSLREIARPIYVSKGIT